jgi:hypothetical protein
MAKHRTARGAESGCQPGTQRQNLRISGSGFSHIGALRQPACHRFASREAEDQNSRRRNK